MNQNQELITFSVDLENLLVDHSHYSVGPIQFKNGYSTLRLVEHPSLNIYELIIKQAK